MTAPRTTTVRSASSTAIANRTASAENSTAESANSHQIRIRLAAAGPKALQDLVGRPAQDIRVVEALGQQGEAGVEENRDGDQHDPGDGLLAQGVPRVRRSTGLS